MLLLYEFDVFDVELYFGFSAPIVFLKVVAEVEEVTAAHACEGFALLEGDGRVLMMNLLNQIRFIKRFIILKIE